MSAESFSLVVRSIATLLWPLMLGVAALILRNPVKQMLPRVTSARARFPGGEIEAILDTAVVEAQVVEAQAAVQTVESTISDDAARTILQKVDLLLSEVVTSITSLPGRRPPMEPLPDDLTEYLRALLGSGLLAATSADGVAYVLTDHMIGGGKHETMWARFRQDGLNLKLFEPITSPNPKAAFEAATGIAVGAPPRT